MRETGQKAWQDNSMNPKQPSHAYVEWLENKVNAANDFFEEENKLVRKLFDLDEILDFQLEHNVEILRGEDYQYSCYIDRKAYAPSLTPMRALVVGIKMFKEHCEE